MGHLSSLAHPGYSLGEESDRLWRAVAIPVWGQIKRRGRAVSTRTDRLGRNGHEMARWRSVAWWPEVTHPFPCPGATTCNDISTKSGQRREQPEDQAYPESGNHRMATSRQGVEFRTSLTSSVCRTSSRPLQFPSSLRLASRMGPKTSKAEHPTLVETKTVTIPRIPQDIIDEILDHLVTISGTHHLQACALVSKSWVPSCRRRLFHTVLFTWLDARRWLRTFPVPEESPAHHVRDLCIRIGGPVDWDPDAFLGFIPWFTNVRRMTLVRYGGRYCGNLPLEMPLLRKLPRSVTSLTINAGGITLAEIRNIIALLPNMDDLFLSGALVSVNELERIVMTLRGGFAGKFGLRVACYAGRDTMDMLFEILIGLHFTEVEILCARECLPSAVKLVEACGKTLVKLSHEATTHRKYREPGWLWRAKHQC